MSFPSPNSNSQSALTFIGELREFPMVGTSFTKPNPLAYGGQEEWLRTGVLKAAAPMYAQAANDPTTGVGGVQMTTGLSANIWGFETDNAGNWVAYGNNATNVYKSTDNGKTWAALAHNLGVYCSSAAYDATLGGWAFSGYTGTNLVVSTTTSLGTAATLRYNTAMSGGLNSQGGTCARSNGAGRILVVAAGAGNNTCVFSTDLATWTSATTGPSTGTYGVVLAVGGTRWVLGNDNTLTSFSTDGGVTWTAGSVSPGPLRQLEYLNNQFVGTYSNNIAYSATGTSAWTTFSTPTAWSNVLGPTGSFGSRMWFDGVNYVFACTNGYLAKTPNFTEYYYQPTIGPVISVSLGSIGFSSSGDYCQGSSAVSFFGNVTRSDYVGHPYLLDNGFSATATPYCTAYYQRIR